MRPAVFLAALALGALAGPVAAQESVPANQFPANPLQAKQCAVWAFAMSERAVDDQEAQEALAHFGSYLVGYFEGTTGQPIGNLEEAPAVREVDTNLDGFTATCAPLMLGYGNRMTAWSEVLGRISGSAPAGK